MRAGHGGAPGQHLLAQAGDEHVVLAQEGGDLGGHLHIASAPATGRQRIVVFDLDDDELVLGGQTAQQVDNTGNQDRVGVGGIGDEDYEAASAVPGRDAVQQSGQIGGAGRRPPARPQGPRERNR